MQYPVSFQVNIIHCLLCICGQVPVDAYHF